jgi:hypothetical protein
MTAKLTERSQPINEFATSDENGLFPTRGNPIVVNQFFTFNGTPREPSKYVQVGGVGGNIVAENADGNHFLVYALIPGIYYPCEAVRIVTSAVLGDGNTYTTTATNMAWLGGK